MSDGFPTQTIFFAFCWFLLPCFHVVLFVLLAIPCGWWIWRISFWSQWMYVRYHSRSMTSRRGKLHKGVKCGFNFEVFSIFCQQMQSVDKWESKCPPVDATDATVVIWQKFMGFQSIADDIRQTQIHRCSYIPQKKCGLNLFHLTIQEGSRSLKHFNIQAFREFRKVLEEFGSVRHKFPEEAWDKFKKLSKVLDKFLQHVAIVVGNHRFVSFLFFLLFLFFDYVNQKVFFCCASTLSFSSIAARFHPNWFFVVSVRVFSLFGFWTMPSSCSFCSMNLTIAIGHKIVFWNHVLVIFCFKLVACKQNMMLVLN